MQVAGSQAVTRFQPPGPGHRCDMRGEMLQRSTGLVAPCATRGEQVTSCPGHGGGEQDSSTELIK